MGCRWTCEPILSILIFTIRSEFVFYFIGKENSVKSDLENFENSIERINHA